MPIYPGNVAVFSTKVDLKDTVFAEHVNSLQDEITSTQRALGTGLLSSTWATSYTNPSSHDSLSSRLTNIEGGIRTLELGKLNLSGGTLTGTLSGTSASFSGSVSGSAFSGTGSSLTGLNATNVSSGTLSWQRLENSGVTPGTYAKVTVDIKGRVIQTGTLTQADLPSPLSATTSDRWTNARTISLTGDVSGSASVDGSANVAIATTIEGLPVEYTTHFFLGGM